MFKRLMLPVLALAMVAALFGAAAGAQGGDDAGNTGPGPEVPSDGVAALPPDDGSATLADATGDFVYTPVPPCRVLDTRIGTGTYNGPFGNGTVKSFNVNGNFAAQGGAAACQGDVPDARAFALTITVANSTGNGNFRAWAFGGPVPPASILNFGAAANFANSSIVPAAFLAGDDLSVRWDMAPGRVAEVIVDIVGYFDIPEETPCPAGTESLAGSCWETAQRSPATYFVASDACGTAGRALPEPAIMRSVRASLNNFSGPEWTGDGIDSEGGAFRGLTLQATGGFAELGTLSTENYRCVAAKGTDF